MNKSAILHIPMSQYAYGLDESHVVIRLRAEKGDITKCQLFYGDRSCRKTPVDFTQVELNVVASDSLFDYFEVVLENPYKRLCYYFELTDGVDSILYYGDQFCKAPVDDRSEYFQLPFNHRGDIVNPPEWVKSAIIYNIFPDSFASEKEYISGKPTAKLFPAELDQKGRIYYKDAGVKSLEALYPIDEALDNLQDDAGIITHGKLGGCIRGITENVEYIASLGLNAIYINPLFAASEYHKYDLIDYYHIDPCFGTNEDFKEMVETFHDHGIRVIIDGVFNHCGWRFFAFEDVVKNGENSPYVDWFYGLHFPIHRPDNYEEYPPYECFGYERLMPKLNTLNPKVREYFCEVGRYWVREFGIDGWRLDVASEVDDRFWREFYCGVKEENPEAVLIGEVWETANHWLDGKIFDSAMNYDFRKHCRRFFAEETIDAAGFDARVTDMRMRYRKQTMFAQLNVLDSHDVSRFLSLCGGDKHKYRLAIVFQMTFPGMPSIFYGDELGVQGILEEEYRQPMPWENAENSCVKAFFQKLIALRKNEEALTLGEYHTLLAKEGSYLYAFERVLSDTRIRVMLNMGEDTKLPAHLLEGEVLCAEGLDNGVLQTHGFAIYKKKGL